MVNDRNSGLSARRLKGFRAPVAAAVVLAAHLLAPQAWANGPADTPAAPEAASATTKPVAVDAKAGAQATTRPSGPAVLPARTKDRPGFWKNDDSSGGTDNILWRMLAYTLVILVIGVVGRIVIRKWAPKLGSSRGREMSTVETIYLGPKKAVHLVQVGTRRFLLGGSSDGVCMLAEVTKAFPDLLDSEMARRDAGDEPDETHETGDLQ